MTIEESQTIFRKMTALFRFALFLLSVSTSTLAFSVTPHVTTTIRPISSRLQMSSVPREPPKRDVLPPSPEDQLVMTGDVASLFIYSFLDHSLNEMYVQSVMEDFESTRNLVGADDFPSQIPVWFDVLHSNNMPIDKLLSIMGAEGASYSPAIATAGAASVAITTCWLLSGYFTKAFLFRNTVECSPAQALWVTCKTWMVAAVLMVGVAMGSDYIMGQYFSLHSPSLGGITRADAAYIFDSFSVLVTWRFLLSWLLGGTDKK